ncbi:MAG: hypothetical protein ACLROY_03555 [Mediterraneibacter sp.]
MIIFYKRYENSFISTILDFFGACFQMIAIILAAYQILDVIQSLGEEGSIVFTDILSLVTVCVIVFLAGKGMRKGARKIAENKAKRK